MCLLISFDSTQLLLCDILAKDYQISRLLQGIYDTMAPHFEFDYRQLIYSEAQGCLSPPSNLERQCMV